MSWSRIGSSFPCSTESSESGFSIVMVMTSLAIVSVVALGASRFLIKAERTRQEVKAHSAPQDIESLLQTKIKKTVKTFVAGGCRGALELNATKLGTHVLVRSARNVGAPRGIKAKYTTAARRCLSQPQLRPRGSSSRSASAAYFCLRFQMKDDPDAKNQATSFSNSDFAFAEVYAKLRASDTLNGIRCNAVEAKQAPPNTGLEIYYTLYWGRKVKSRFIQQSKSTTFLTSLD